MLTQDYPPAIGGIQTYADCLSREWAPHCRDFAVMAPGGAGSEAFDSGQSFDVIRVPSTSNVMRLTVYPHLKRLLKQRRFDAIFTGHWYVAAAALRAKRKGLVERVFVAAHAQELRKNIMPTGLQTVYRRHRQSVLRRADCIFPVSHYTGKLLTEDGVLEHQISVVPNGTEAARFNVASASGARDSFRSQYDLGEGPLIGTVARLVPRKGIDTVIAAMPALLKVVPNLNYVIVGDGADRQRLEQLAVSLGVSARCKFLGKIPYEDLVNSYFALDCFVMPARQIGSSVEGFGLVFCEASACGIPVVGGRSGGVPDAVIDGKSGHLVEPDNVDAFIEGLLPILLDPEYASRLGAFGKSYVTEHGTWAAVAQKLLAEMSTRCELR
jgi:phosphatidyl-myo-inositol dimannoside synthase